MAFVTCHALRCYVFGLAVMAEDQQINGDAGDQVAAGDGSRQRLVIWPAPGRAVHLGDNACTTAAS